MSERTHDPSRGNRHANDPFEPGPVTVLRREQLVPNLQLLTVRAPVVASKIKPGQFVIVRADEYGERIPLTVADWDREEGTVTCVFMQVGTSTYKLGQLEPGDVVLAKGSQTGIRLEKAIKEMLREPKRARELLVRQEDEWLLS